MVLLSPRVLMDVVGTLLPVRDRGAQFEPLREADYEREVPEWHEVVGVSEGELGGVLTRVRMGKKAPGPDDIPGRAWALAGQEFGERLRQSLTLCFRHG